MGDFGFGFSNRSSDFTPVTTETDYGAGDEGFEDYQEPLSKEELESYAENSDDFLLKRRVIITFMPEQEAEMKKYLSTNEENLRVVYTLDELLKMKEG